MGHGYLLGCPEGGEAKLMAAVNRVDAAMCKIRDGGKIKARDRIAVLAALNLAFDISENEGDSVPTQAEPMPLTLNRRQSDVLLEPLLRRLDTPNAWIIGPLVVTIALTGSGAEWSAMPRWMVNGGQLLIGCALGSRFSAGFFRAAPRFLLSVAATVLLSLTLAACFGVGLSWAAGIDLPTTLLATAPGGVAEMSLTARALHLGVPVVTSFHVTRMAFLVLSAAPVFGWGRRWATRGQ
eukprot:gene41533-55059_t